MSDSLAVASERVVDEILDGRGQVRRRGNVVLRPLAPWSPGVLAVLRHLKREGFSGRHASSAMASWTGMKQSPSFVPRVHRVFNIGTLNNLPAYFCEIGVPIDGRHLEAVETIFRVARERRELGQVYQSSPIARRFVKASSAHLSMMNGRDTMMIELIGLNGNDGGMELLKAYERRSTRSAAGRTGAT